MIKRNKVISIFYFVAKSIIIVIIDGITIPTKACLPYLFTITVFQNENKYKKEKHLQASKHSCNSCIRVERSCYFLVVWGSINDTWWAKSRVITRYVCETRMLPQAGPYFRKL